MQFQRKPRNLPVVLSVEEIAALMAAVPGPGLKYRAALGISYGAGLRASEVCHLKVMDIDSERMLIRVDEGISNNRLISADAKTVTFRWRDYRIKNGDRQKSCSWPLTSSSAAF
ncbi:tyrosine-type recombinase/integrase [Pseudaminobacter sp. NGMCC 1.201702]|uniref:tyrosine-type recombinase/integrase n=1 Tax=Pseudaminobacter sp. NGMCC 1.201702 TaxID=3391825 RepID=UPI0039EE4D1D